MRPHSGTHVTRLPAQWWKAAGWVQSLGEHQPSLQSLHCTYHQYGHGSWHLDTFPVPGALSTHPHQVSSVSTKWPSWALGQMPFHWHGAPDQPPARLSTFVILITRVFLRKNSAMCPYKVTLVLLVSYLQAPNSITFWRNKMCLIYRRMVYTLISQ